MVHSKNKKISGLRGERRFLFKFKLAKKKLRVHWQRDILVACREIKIDRLPQH